MDGEHTGDRRTVLGWLFGGGVAVAAVAAVASRAGAERKDVELKDVPKNVTDAANDYVSAHFKLKVEWLSAVRIEDEEPGKKKARKKVAYELDGRRKGDLDVTLVITEAGKVTEVDRELKDLTRVPAKALTAVKDKWPMFDLKEAHTIHQGEDLANPKAQRDTVYDLRGTVGKKARDLELQVSADGAILEYTVEMPEKKWPEEVTKALDAKRPKFKYDTVLALHEGDKIIGYHFLGKGPKGKEITISISPDGKHIEVVE